MFVLEERKMKKAMNQSTLTTLLNGVSICALLLMMAALRFGELSVLHPMLSAGYALSVVLGALVLEEEITGSKLLGIAVITAGLVCLSTSKGQR